VGRVEKEIVAKILSDKRTYLSDDFSAGDSTNALDKPLLHFQSCLFFHNAHTKVDEYWIKYAEVKYRIF